MVTDVEKIYGTKYKKDKTMWTEHFAGTGYVTVTKLKMIYKKEGLMFLFTIRDDKPQDKLTDIELKSPFEEALLFAAALVSLKVEIPGPFKRNRDEVSDYIKKYYL